MTHSVSRQAAGPEAGPSPLAQIIDTIPDDYAGDRLELSVNTLNHQVLSERNPVAVALADSATRRQAAKQKADAASANLLDTADRVDAAIGELAQLHRRRTSHDPRCLTCRTPGGKPCPWPCATYLVFARRGLLPLPSDEQITLLHAYGAYLTTRSDHALRRFQQLADAAELARRHAPNTPPTRP